MMADINECEKQELNDCDATCGYCVDKVTFGSLEDRK